MMAQSNQKKFIEAEAVNFENVPIISGSAMSKVELSYFPSDSHQIQNISYLHIPSGFRKFTCDLLWPTILSIPL